MHVDPFTLVAQVLNFLALVWVLKKFLYKPVLDAVDARERRIAASVADAEKARVQAETEAALLKRSRESLEGARAQMMEEARKAAEAERARMAAQAAEEMAAQRADGMRALEAERRALAAGLADAVRREVFALAGQVLADLAEDSLEERAAGAMRRRLAALDVDARRALAEAVEAGGGRALVRSALPLAEGARQALGADVASALGRPVTLDFECHAGLVWGLELVAAGQKIEWNVEARLAALQESMAREIERGGDGGHG